MNWNWISLSCFVDPVAKDLRLLWQFFSSLDGVIEVYLALEISTGFLRKDDLSQLRWKDRYMFQPCVESVDCLLDLRKFLPRCFWVLKPSEQFYVCFSVDYGSDLLLVEELREGLGYFFVLVHFVGHFYLTLCCDYRILVLLWGVYVLVDLLYLLIRLISKLFDLLIDDLPRVIV